MHRKEDERARLPERKHMRLRPDAYRQPGRWYYVTICCDGKRPRLAAPKHRDAVREALFRVAGSQEAVVLAYTILPDHVHLICSCGTRGLPALVGAFKGLASKRLRLLGKRSTPWQARYFDHVVRSDESLSEKCRYVWENPVRRGLADNAEEYPWNGQIRV